MLKRRKTWQGTSPSRAPHPDLDNGLGAKQSQRIVRILTLIFVTAECCWDLLRIAVWVSIMLWSRHRCLMSFAESIWPTPRGLHDYSTTWFIFPGSSWLRHYGSGALVRTWLHFASKPATEKKQQAMCKCCSLGAGMHLKKYILLYNIIYLCASQKQIMIKHCYIQHCIGPS